MMIYGERRSMERLYWISMMAPATHEWWLARLLYPFFLSLAGDISEEATPDPIPNSEVKLFCVDGTAWVTAWESRTSPAFFCSDSGDGVAFY